MRLANLPRILWISRPGAEKSLAKPESGCDGGISTISAGYG